MQPKESRQVQRINSLSEKTEKELNNNESLSLFSSLRLVGGAKSKREEKANEKNNIKVFPQTLEELKIKC